MCTYVVQPTQNRTSVRLGATPGGAAPKLDLATHVATGCRGKPNRAQPRSLTLTYRPTPPQLQLSLETVPGPGAAQRKR